MPNNEIPGFYACTPNIPSKDDLNKWFNIQRNNNISLPDWFIKQFEGCNLQSIVDNLNSWHNSADELSTIRATLMVNYGPGRKFDIGLKNEGSTLSMLMQVLEHFCNSSVS